MLKKYGKMILEKIDRLFEILNGLLFIISGLLIILIGCISYIFTIIMGFIIFILLLPVIFISKK